MISKIFFFGALAAIVATAYWRMTTWTASPLVPETDVPTLILLGILGYFAFDLGPGTSGLPK